MKPLAFQAIATLSAALMLTFGTATGIAVAQIAAEPKDPLLERIIVTARRRDEDLQRTPVSVAVIGRQEIGSRGLADLSEIGSSVPNLEFDFTAPISGGTNNASVFIRGIGQTDYVPSKDTGVGIYLDGVYIARSVGSVLSLLDIDRVEVMRGPQGTLFGRNTVGGAINVLTTRPGDEFVAKLDATVGSYDRADLRGWFDTPLGDRVAARWSFASVNRDGYLRRTLAGDRMGNEHRLVGRLVFDIKASDRLYAVVSVDYAHADEESTASKLVSTDTLVPTSPFSIGDPGTIFAGQAYNVLIGGPPEGVSTGFGTLPSLPAGLPSYDRRWLSAGEFETNSTGPNYSEHGVAGASVSLRWLLERLRIESISAIRTTDANFGRDPDGSPLVIGESEVWVDHRQKSQEIRFSGDARGGRLHWIAGVFYLSETGKQRDRVPFADETFQTYASLDIPISNFLLANGPDSINSVESSAVFGEGTLVLTDRIELTAGLRRTRDRRETAGNSTVGGFPSVVNPLASMQVDNTSGRVILSYGLTDSRMTYVSYSEGFKSGGFNHRLALAPPPFEQLQQPTRFAPEFVETVEVGFKTGLGNDRARLNAAAFHSRYRDVQLLVFDLGVPRTINAAAATIDGLEFEFEAALSDRWRIDLGYGYLDARYTNLDRTIPGAFGNPISIVPLTLDNMFVNSPEHGLSAGASARLPLRAGELWFRTDLSFRSEVANDAVNTPELVQDDLWLASAAVGWAPASCRCELAIFARNLTDETYFVSGAADSPGAGIAERIMARPREWGARFSYRFR